MDYLESVQTYINNFDFNDAPLSSFNAPLIGGLLYLAVIFSLQSQIKKGEPYKVLTILHNLFLCLLSAVMLLGILMNVFVIGSKKGFFYVYCDDPTHPLGTMEKGPIAFWCYVFYASKYYEMLDTVLLVLKKRPLTLVHCYHHFIVPFLFWSFLHTATTAHWFLSVANCLVHVIMYYYYARTCMGAKIWWKKYLTTLQITQFIIDVIFCWGCMIKHYLWKKNYILNDCEGDQAAGWFGCLLLSSYLLLFVDFFHRTYTQQDKRKRETKKSK